MSSSDRLTEYHNGVAVIRDKNKLKEAMEKLAYYEDIEKECDMEKITTEMAEYICDMCCGNLDDVRSQEEADVICDECKLSKFIKDICISYNKLNTFVGSQVEHLLKKEYELKRELKSYKDLEEQGLLLKLPAPLDGVETFELDGNGIWLRLPCHLGDTVYEIEGVKWVGDRDWQYRSHKEAYAKEVEFTLKKYDMFGLTVFLTKEEAEKKIAEERLAEMEK